MPTLRDRWPSQSAFLFAAIGSAVGLGNVWRFSYLVGKHGGAAFLIPYFIILLAMGIPLLLMEFAIGQRFQQGIMNSFRKIHPACEGIGICAMITAFGICCYYSMITGWTVLYSYYSLGLEWGEDTRSFFFNTVLNVSGSPEQMGAFSNGALAVLLFSWVCVYFSIWKGVKSVSKVVAITMPLPVLLLLVLMIRGFFLEGFQEGIWFYFVPDFRTLLDPDVWVAALAQVFFSLSLGLGVMIAYGSFRKQKSPLVKMTYLTAISDTLIALISGFTVFATVGYMATKSGVPVGELAAQGPSLAFIVFPEILSVLPAPALFSFIFFIMLFTFAIDSLFSMVEAIAVVFKDWLPKSNQSIIVLFVCASCFICSTIFATQGGIYYLEIVDHFITRYLLIGGALCQVVAVAWVFGAERLMEEINGYSKWQVGRFWVFTLRYLCPAFLGILLLVALKEDLTKPFGGYSQPILFMYGWSIVCISLIVCSAASYFSYRQAINGKREIEGEGS